MKFWPITGKGGGGGGGGGGGDIDFSPIRGIISLYFCYIPALYKEYFPICFY